MIFLSFPYWAFTTGDCMITMRYVHTLPELFGQLYLFNQSCQCERFQQLRLTHTSWTLLFVHLAYVVGVQNRHPKSSSSLKSSADTGQMPMEQNPTPKIVSKHQIMQNSLATIPPTWFAGWLLYIDIQREIGI
jgi:hypothetical protein